jgi:hypothetical protein
LGKHFDAKHTVEEESSICLDGETHTVEAIDKEGDIRTRVESCIEGSASRYFHNLARIAVAQFPYCAAIDRNEYSNADSSRLVECSRLDGDRMTAAEFHNQLERHDFGCCLKTEQSSKIEYMFDDAILFSWPGMPVVRDKASAAKMWINESITEQRIYADAHDSVRLEGLITICETEKADLSERLNAPFTTAWKRGPDGQFRMHSFSYSADQIVLQRSYTREQYDRKLRSKTKWPPGREILPQSVVISTTPLTNKYDDLGPCIYD